MTIIMIAPLIALSLSFTESISGYGKEMSSLVRLKSSYYFYDSVDQDLLRSGQIVEKRAAVAALNWVIENGKPLNSSEETLQELFENGSINGTEQSIMNRSTIYDWLNTTQKISADRGYILNLSLNFTEDNLEMVSPYNMAFTLDYSLELTDRQKLFSLKKNLSKYPRVSVAGLEDPMITLRTGGKLIYPVRRANFSHFTMELVDGRGNNSWGAGRSVVLPSDPGVIDNIDPALRDDRVLVINSSVDTDLMDDFAGVVIKEDVDMTGFDKPYVVGVPNVTVVPNGTRIVVEGNQSRVWSIENLYETWDEGYHVPGDGPSFLDRLENNLTNSYPRGGMNVFVKKEDLEDADLDVRDRSNLAHIYFSEDTTVDYRVKGMPRSFKIDEEHLEDFGLQNTLSFR